MKPLIVPRKRRSVAEATKLWQSAFYVDKRKKRTWCYVNPPRSFDYPRCACGQANLMWSEFQNHVWCPVCEKDFIPEYQGILDGPIPILTATMLGVNFDRYNIETGKVSRLNIDTMEYTEDA